MAAMNAVGLPAVAAEYFLVVNTATDMSPDQSSVRLGSEQWISLKGTVEEAIKRHLWRFPSRVAYEAECDRLRIIRFTLTHAGMSAQFLGYLRFELRGWRQSTRGTWSTFSARVRGDLPLHIIFQEDVVLWTSEQVLMPFAARLLELHDAAHADYWCCVVREGAHRVENAMG